MAIAEQAGGAAHRENFLLASAYNRTAAELNDANVYLATEAERLGVSAAQVADVTRIKGTYDGVYENYRNPLTHTRGAQLAMEEAYKEASEFLNTLQQQIKNDANVTLNGDDFAMMHIHVDKPTRTRTPRPTAIPTLNLIGTRPRENHFFATYPDGEGQAHRRLPYRNHLRVRMAIMPPGSTEMPSTGDYSGVYDFGRADFTINSPPNTPSASIGYLLVSYVNFRGEAGPEGDPFKFTIV